VEIRVSSPIQTEPGTHPVSYAIGIVCFPRGKEGGCGVYDPPPSSKGKGKGKAIPVYTRTGPEGSRRLRLPDFKTIGTNIKVVRL